MAYVLLSLYLSTSGAEQIAAEDRDRLYSMWSFLPQMISQYFEFEVASFSVSDALA